MRNICQERDVISIKWDNINVITSKNVNCSLIKIVSRVTKCFLVETINCNMNKNKKLENKSLRMQKDVNTNTQVSNQEKDMTKKKPCELDLIRGIESH